VNFSGIKTINVFPLSRIFHFLFIQEGEIKLEGREDISEDLPVLNGTPPFLVPIHPSFAEEGILYWQTSRISALVITLQKVMSSKCLCSKLISSKSPHLSSEHLNHSAYGGIFLLFIIKNDSFDLNFQ